MKNDAVLFMNGIGNFVMLSPTLDLMNSPTIFIPLSDTRAKLIKSISPWPVKTVDDRIDDAFDEATKGYKRIFSVWCFPPALRPPRARTLPPPEWSQGYHESEYYAQMLGGTKIASPKVTTSPSWQLHTGDDERLIAISNGGSSRHGKTWALKRWSPSSFATVTKKLLAYDPNIQFVFVGTMDERKNGEVIQKEIDHKLWNFAGLLTLSQTADILQQCNVLISNDTGNMHIANALGVSTVSLFGFTSITKNRPMLSHENAVIIESSGGGCPHHPCFGTKHMWECKKSICMEAITIDEVVEGVIDVIKRTSCGNTKTSR